MKPKLWPVTNFAVFFCYFAVFWVGSAIAGPESDTDRAARIDILLRQLNDESAVLRDQAEQAILELAPLDGADETDKFLLQIPRPQDGMPEEVQQRLTRLRKKIESRQVSEIVSASKLSLSANSMSLAEVLQKIEEQTGNRLLDSREQFGQDASAKSATLEIENEEFWPALDQILDHTQLSTYSFSGEDALALVNREPGAVSRYQRGAYAGPFRVEVLSITAERNMRYPSQENARLEMEVAWEPRLRPIVISQLVENIKITGDDDQPIATASRQPVLEVEVQPTSHSTELIIPIELPSRNVMKIDRLRGEFSALVPGRVVEFKFTDLAKAKGVEQEKGGVKLMLERTRQNHGLWEIHMRLKILGDAAGLESHRGWIFQNMTYLLDKNGEVVDHAGMETTVQSQSEVGLAYFFEITDDISTYTWVYRTPAAVVRVPVAYELRDLELP